MIRQFHRLTSIKKAVNLNLCWDTVSSFTPLTFPYTHASTHPHTQLLNHSHACGCDTATCYIPTPWFHMYCRINVLKMKLFIFFKENLRPLSQIRDFMHFPNHFLQSQSSIAFVCFLVENQNSLWQQLVTGKVMDESVQTQAICKNLTFIATNEEWKHLNRAGFWVYYMFCTRRGSC